MKRVRKTSIDTYRKIEAEGLLSKRRWQVYQVLFGKEPMTGGEVSLAFKEKFLGRFQPNTNIITRLGELRDSGVAEEVGRRVCSVSGETVILWALNDNLPNKIVRPDKIKCPTCKGAGHLSQDRLF